MQGRRRPVGPAAREYFLRIDLKVRSGFEPDLPAYRADVPPETPTDRGGEPEPENQNLENASGETPRVTAPISSLLSTYSLLLTPYSMTPDGIEPPFPERQSGVVPLDHEVVLRRERRRGGVVEVGVEPTESSGSRPDRFAELRTRLCSRTCLLVHEQ